MSDDYADSAETKEEQHLLGCLSHVTKSVDIKIRTLFLNRF